VALEPWASAEAVLELLVELVSNEDELDLARIEALKILELVEVSPMGSVRRPRLRSAKR
jgi:hypothetical protein